MLNYSVAELRIITRLLIKNCYFFSNMCKNIGNMRIVSLHFHKKTRKKELSYRIIM